MQKLRPRIVADRVHHPLSLEDQAHIEVGNENSLAFGDRWCEMFTLRRDDGRHAAAAQRLLQVLLRCDRADLLVRQPAGGVDDETAAFQRMMADGDFHLIGEDRADHGAGKLRDMDLLVLRHQCIAGEGIVVLPAGQRADAADRAVDDLEAGGIPLTPDHPLMECWRDLSPLEDQCPIRIENELRIVERAMIPLVDAERDDDAVFARGCCHCVGRSIWNRTP